MPAEFDDYAASYQKLLSDPLRERFAPGSQFFTRRKWDLLKGFSEPSQRSYREPEVARRWMWVR